MRSVLLRLQLYWALAFNGDYRKAEALDRQLKYLREEKK